MCGLPRITAEQRLLTVDPKEVVDLLGVRPRIVNHVDRVAEDRLPVESSHNSVSLM